MATRKKSQLLAPPGDDVTGEHLGAVGTLLERGASFREAAYLSAVRCHASGAMFWLRWKMLSGSYRRLVALRRS